MSEVQRRLAQATEVSTSFDLIAAPLGLQGVTNSSAQNLIQEMIVLPLFLRSLPRYRALVLFTLRMLARHERLSLITINNLRSLVRKIGVYESIRRHPQQGAIFVDEGMLLIAHNIFVYTNALYTPEEIAHFASLIPLPDLIVYVKAPVDRLVDRSLRRADVRREMRAKSQAQIETYINRAVAMFEQLVKTEEIRSRVLIVENPEITGNGYDQGYSEKYNERYGETIECIMRFVLHHQSSDHSMRDARSLSIKEKEYVD
ncbi:MAG: hypothetical protein IT328_06825 [Caldilineaceae bacterium]|nr:hypothetical protein [Caldilineaceae bacterium]